MSDGRLIECRDATQVGTDTFSARSLHRVSPSVVQITNQST